MNDIEYLKKYYKGNIEYALKRLENGEPVQYIVGDVDFYGNTIKVDKRVLIPRFETEGLVEIALSYLKDGDSIIDLGTGSGCIAITLKKKLPNSNIDAVDISNDALTLAKDNAKLNNVDINFYQGDMLCTNKKYDCIISNPPYIPYDEEVMDIVKNNEPNNALYLIVFTTATSLIMAIAFAIFTVTFTIAVAIAIIITAIVMMMFMTMSI